MGSGTTTTGTILAVLAVALAAATPAGAAITRFSGSGAGSGRLSDPTDIAVDDRDRIVVADNGNQRVQRFTPDGSLIDVVGGPGLGPGQFGSGGLYVAPLPGGRLLVADFRRNLVSRFASNGQFEASWTPADADAIGPGKIAASPAGDAIYTLGAGARISKTDASGNPIGGWTVRDSTGAAPNNVWDVETDGAVVAVLTFVFDGRPHAEISRYDPDGTLIDRWRGNGGETYDNGVLVQPTGIELDAEGNVYVSDMQTIHKFTGDGRYLTKFSVIPDRLAPRPQFPAGPPSGCDGTGYQFYVLSDGLGARDAVFDSAGNAYTLESDRNTVAKIDPAPLAAIGASPYTYRADQGPMPIFMGQGVRLVADKTRVPFSPALRYEWDLDGNGSYDRDTGTDPATTAYYGQAGTLNATVRVTGLRGSTGTASVPLEILPTTATASPAGRPSAMVGEPFALSAAGSVPACSSVTVAWDVDGDGRFETPGPSDGRLTYTPRKPGHFDVGVRIARAGGRVDTDSLGVDVGPAPPRGPVGVSVDDEATFTRDPRVRLDLVWPKYATKAVVANDGGFRRARTFDLAQSIPPWTLDVAGKERLPKVVYVRFLVPGDESASAAPHTDSIVLDTRDPVVTAARRVAGGVSVSGSDNLSGLGAVQVTKDRRRPGARLGVKRKLLGKRSFASRVSAKRAGSRPWVRVLDRAGNASAWRRTG
jgi:sugar lactone lactonase YvrE